MELGRAVADILPSHADDLDEVLAEAFRLLARGVAERRSAFRTPTVATVGSDGAPRIPTVVLRRFEPAARRLTLHTDRRAAKLVDIAHQPSVALHVYDARAGRQTRGKHYVARAENIARYTGGRFNPVGQLNEAPSPLAAGPPEPMVTLPAPKKPLQGRVALLLHEDDLAETLPMGDAQVVAIGGIAVPEARSPSGCAPAAAAWVRCALADGLDRASRHFSVLAMPVENIAAWADTVRCNAVITPYSPSGWTADCLAGAENDLAADSDLSAHAFQREAAH
jgi:hypothetical protein